MEIKRLIVVLLLFMLPATAFALKVQGLYEAEVPVIDQQLENRRVAIKTALQLVLVKLTGDRFAPGRTALQPVMQASDNYVQQFRYRQLNKGSEGAEIELRLWVRFDSVTLNSKLRQLGMPVWGQERPSTLVWLVLQNETGRHLVNMEEHGDIISVVDKRARMRGITLLFPLIDLEDTSRLRASDIWGGFQDAILGASRRYQADAILTGSISSTLSGIWEGRWVSYLEGQMNTWFTEGDLRDVVLDEGIDGMVDNLASRFTRSSSGVETVSIAVGDIFSTEHYAKTLKYLESLSSVAEVRVTEVIPGKVTFLLTAHGGGLAVTQAIELGNTLEAIGLEDGNYRLLP